MTQSAKTCAVVRVPLSLEATDGLGAIAESKAVDPGFLWDEAIPSWNVANAENARLTVYLQGIREGSATDWYQMATWCGDMAKGERASIPSQSDANGEVLTDVLRMKSPFQAAKVKLVLEQVVPGPAPKLKFATICFSKRGTDSLEFTEPTEVPSIDAPQIAQGPFEFGSLAYRRDRVSPEFETWFSSVKGAQYCSPTSLTMVLKYWAAKLNRRDLDVDVPRVVEGVFDSKYPGTGNWSFNTAFAGSFSGMRSYVARLRGIKDLEDLVREGVPVICSVSHNLVLGNGKPAGGDGHLVVIVGFDKDGNPIANDPGKTDEVRRTYKRSDFLLGWNTSERTVYLCYPETLHLPRSLEGIVPKR